MVPPSTTDTRQAYPWMGHFVEQSPFAGEMSLPANFDE
jgi:hypothetical protein